MHVSLCRLITPSRSWSGSRSTAGPRMQVREISGSDCGDIMILSTETSTGQYLGKYGLLSDFVKIVFSHQLWLLQRMGPNNNVPHNIPYWLINRSNCKTVFTTDSKANQSNKKINGTEQNTLSFLHMLYRFYIRYLLVFFFCNRVNGLEGSNIIVI